VLPFKISNRKYRAPDIVFRTEVEFFSYHCKLAREQIEPNRGIVAIVMDGMKEFRQGTSVPIDENGIQTAKLKVASADGGYPVIADTQSGKGERLKPGNLVIWVPRTHHGSRFAEHGYRGDMRSAWEGFITAKIEPVLLRTGDGFSIICSYS
jgi:hypothetical protein